MATCLYPVGILSSLLRKWVLPHICALWFLEVLLSVNLLNGLRIILLSLFSLFLLFILSLFLWLGLFRVYVYFGLLFLLLVSSFISDLFFVLLDLLPLLLYFSSLYDDLYCVGIYICSHGNSNFIGRICRLPSFVFHPFSVFNHSLFSS